MSKSTGNTIRDTISNSKVRTNPIVYSYSLHGIYAGNTAGVFDSMMVFISGCPSKNHVRYSDIEENVQSSFRFQLFLNKLLAIVENGIWDKCVFKTPISNIVLPSSTRKCVQNPRTARKKMTMMISIHVVRSRSCMLCICASN